jgi:DNA-binding transcriptional MocR family regulator
MAPGCRLGWITAQPAIIERILRITETSTQQPSGFVQAMVAEMIVGPASSKDGGRGGGKDGKGWSMDGWVRWLEGLRGAYERRMNTMCKILDEGNNAVTVSTVPRCRCRHHHNSWEVVRKAPMFTFEWPHGGMFIWIKVDFFSHPLHGKVPYPKLAMALWVFLTTKPYLALVAPGSIFSTTDEIQEKKGWQYFRLCYAAVNDDQVESTARRFVQGVQDFWAKTEVEDPDDEEGVLADVEQMRQLFRCLGC